MWGDHVGPLNWAATFHCHCLLPLPLLQFDDHVIQMQDKPLEREMGRCNRNLLLVNLFILGFISFAAFVSQKYWYNFANGPFPADVKSLFTTNNPALLDKQYIVLKGAKTLNSGYTQVYETYDKSTDQVKSREIRGYYLLLLVDSGAVIVRSPVKTSAVSFEGKLEPVPSDIYQKLVQPLKPEVRKRVSLLMLDVVGYRQSGFGAIAFGVPMLILALWNLRKLIMRRSEEELHPIMKGLAAQGNMRELAAELNEELRSPDKKELGGAIILRHFVVGRFPFTLDVIDMENIVWAYKLQTNHSINFIPTGTTVELVVNTKDGRTHKFSGSNKQMDEALMAIGRNAPWIYCGFSEQLKNAWSKNFREMATAVKEAREDYYSQQRQKKAGPASGNA